MLQCKTVIKRHVPAPRRAGAATSYGPVSACLCLWPSDTNRSSVELDGRIELVFGKEASFDLSYTVL